ncbi:MAG: serine/threonine protein kinase [Planctomycetota bacterium]|jgi:serine/threonine protein kinase
MEESPLSSDTQVVINDRFEIKEPLNGGGLSRLFRAFDRKTGAPVAIKMWDPIAGPNSNEEVPRQLRRFAREAKLLERLKNCKQVVNYVDADMSSEQPWIAMDYLSGRTLRSLIDDEPGRMSLPRFLHLAKELVQGLAGIHKEGILHRDLSPENILIVRDDDRQVHAYFLDFGIGKSLEQEAQPVTQMPTFLGKPEYVSPEQTRGELVPGMDVYAVGVMLYEMLTGEVPIQVSSFAEVSRVRKEQPTPLESHNSSRRVPEEMCQLIMACLAKEPAERPSLADLEDCINRVRKRHESGENLSTEFSQWQISRLDANLGRTQTVLEPRMEIGAYRTEWLTNSEDGRETWLARDIESGKEVALEVFCGNQNLRTMHLDAFEAAKNLKHENIQEIYDWGDTKTFSWAALELVKGSSLAETLKAGKPLAPGQILQIGQGILDALVEANKGGLCHGRLTPECILLDEFDMVKLAGVGSNPNLSPADCRITHGAQSAWLAPETHLGVESSVAGDLYSLGCLLYAMITTESPFEGSDMAQAYRHVNERPIDVLELQPDLEPPYLAKIIVWLLNKEPEKRPQSAARVLEAFNQCFSKNHRAEQESAGAEIEGPESPERRNWMDRIFRRGQD